MVKRCRVNFLGEVKEDGTDIFIGSLAMTTSVNGELIGPDGVDWENKKKREEENNSLEAGDPRIIWWFRSKQTRSRVLSLTFYLQITSRLVIIAEVL